MFLVDDAVWRDLFKSFLIAVLSLFAGSLWTRLRSLPRQEFESYCKRMDERVESLLKNEQSTVKELRQDTEKHFSEIEMKMGTAQQDREKASVQLARIETDLAGLRLMINELRSDIRNQRP